MRAREERERRERERKRDRERDTGSGQTQAENSEKLQGSIFVPSFQLKFPRINCDRLHSSLLPEHVNINIYIHIYIYEIGYC